MVFEDFRQTIWEQSAFAFRPSGVQVAGQARRQAGRQGSQLTRNGHPTHTNSRRAFPSTKTAPSHPIQPTFIASAPVLRTDGSHSLASKRCGATSPSVPAPPATARSQSESEGASEAASSVVAGLAENARRTAARENASATAAAPEPVAEFAAAAAAAVVRERPLLPPTRLHAEGGGEWG